LQKWVAEAVQNLAPIGGAEKNGSDADAYAEAMQKVGYKLYEYSTKSDADKHRYSGLSRLIRSNLLHPPNALSICGLQKNGTDAENCAVCHAVSRADVSETHSADIRAERIAVVGAEPDAAPAGQPVYRGAAQSFPPAS
jgi:hypothetical protein